MRSNWKKIRIKDKVIDKIKIFKSVLMKSTPMLKILIEVTS